MPQRLAATHLQEPRLVVVLAGAATVGTRTATALERAVVPNLAALAERGRCGRLRAVAPHMPADAPSAQAALLGATLPEALDQGAVAAESADVVVGAGERCTLIEVLDHTGDAAPALHVARAADVLRGRLSGYRVGAIRRGNQILLVGPGWPSLPEVDGLHLRVAPAGYVPDRPSLDADTVAIATAGSSLLGVARLLGAATVVIDATRGGRQDPVPARLRQAAGRALLGGARTVVVESSAPLVARRGHSDQPNRERAVAEVLGRLDRELIGPLRTAASWQGAAFVVTADVARVSAGQPTTGDVPIIVAGGRDEPVSDASPRVAADGTMLPPRHSERGVADRPIVTSPFAVPPARDPNAPVRFTRDPTTGITTPEEQAAS